MSDKLKRTLEKGRKAFNQRNYEAAGRLFEEVVTARADAHEGWFGLGEVAMAIGQMDTAVQFLEHAVQLQPDVARYQQRLANSTAVSACTRRAWPCCFRPVAGPLRTWGSCAV